MPALIPPATGRRLSWSAVPEPVRLAVERLAGDDVVHAATQRGGFSPGVAARLRLCDGRRVFVKAVSAEANPDSPGLHRAEARHTAALPRTVAAPRLLGVHDDGRWVALVLTDVEGRQPAVPWRREEWERVLSAVTGLSASLTPAPFPAPRAEEALGAAFSQWRQAAGTGPPAGLDPWAAARLPLLAGLERTWGEQARGDTLIHADLRADNMLLTADGGLTFVDWPHAVRAAPWLDLVLMLPCVAAQGGPDPQSVVARSTLTRNVEPDRITAVLAALAGFFAVNALRPAPPGLPTLRAFQAAQGAAALRWLRVRLAPRR